MLDQSGKEEKELCLGQGLAQTLPLAHGKWDEVFVFDNISFVIQEPFWPELLPLGPVISLEDLGHDGVDQRVGRDHEVLHLVILSVANDDVVGNTMTLGQRFFSRKMLNSHRNNIAMPLYLHDDCFSVGKVGLIAH